MPGERSWRVLKVDDNKAGRYVTTEILKAAGFDMFKATNGTDARGEKISAELEGEGKGTTSCFRLPGVPPVEGF